MVPASNAGLYDDVCSFIHFCVALNNAQQHLGEPFYAGTKKGSTILCSHTRQHSTGHYPWSISVGSAGRTSWMRLLYICSICPNWCGRKQIGDDCQTIEDVQSSRKWKSLHDIFETALRKNTQSDATHKPRLLTSPSCCIVSESL